MSSKPPAYLADYNVGYDTDTISITSTAPSIQGTNYDAVKVLSERAPCEGEDDVMYYLIEWEEYPMHRCTWEPEYHLDETNLLELWELEKKSLGEAAAQELMETNETKHLYAKDLAQEAKEYRQKLRRKKRRRNNARPRLVDDSGSESEAVAPLEVQRQASPNTLLQAREVEDASQLNSLFQDSQEPGYTGGDIPQGTQDSGLFVRPAPANRRPPLQQSDSSSSSEEDDAETSDNSLVGEMLSASTSKTTLGNSTRMAQAHPPQKSPSAKAEKPKAVLTRGSTAATNVSTPGDNESGQRIVQPSVVFNAGAAKTTPLKPQPVADTSGTVKPSPLRPQHAADTSVPFNQAPLTPQPTTETPGVVKPPLQRPRPKPNSLKSMKRTEPPKPTSGIRIVNQPKVQSTPWRNSEKLYSTLKFRRNAQKRGQVEATPDPGALRFVGALPPGMDRPQPSAPDNDVYGRRETGNRRPQELDDDDLPRRTYVDDVTPLHDWEAEKIPQICPEWRLSNNCTFGAQKCRYLHRNKDASGRALPLAELNGYIPPKHHKPAVTCRFWLLGPKGCLRSDEECLYAHWNTGHVLSEDRSTSEITDPHKTPFSESKTVPQTTTAAARYVHEQESTLTKRAVDKSIPLKDLTCPYWFYMPTGCFKPEKECQFAHMNTGLVADRRNYGFNTVIDAESRPASERAMDHIEPNARRSSASVLERTGNLVPSVRLPATEMTCYFWTIGNCRYTAESCKFPHRHTGAIAAAPATRPCKFWTRDGSCPKPRCPFQHEQVGSMSNQRDIGGPSRLNRESSPRELFEESHLAVRDTVMPDAVHGDTSGESPRPSHTIPLSPQVDIQPLPLLHQSPVIAEIAQADAVCLTLKADIERICKLDFVDMFTRNDGSAPLDRRAFLLYHPEQHAEEVELISRWLLMHHVEIGGTWFVGSWDQFKQHILKGGSGVLIAHPDFEYFSDLPGFGQLLQKEVRVWSVGMQDGIEYNPHLEGSPAVMRHDRFEIFPHGGFIYITDEVFEQKPELALQIVRQFAEKIARLRLLAGPIVPWQAVDDACLLWRICVRPELAELLFQVCEEQAEEVDAGEPSATSRAELYMMLTEEKLVDDSSDIVCQIPDKFPIMSERRVAADAQLDYFKTLARSQQEANLTMIRHYTLVQVELRRDYRQFYVVHTDAMASYVQDWRHEVQSIAAAITPEMCFEELEKDGSASMFDFCERHMSELQAKD